MARTRRPILLALALVLVSSACGGADDVGAQPPPPDDAASSGDDDPEGGVPVGPIDPSLDGEVEAALALVDRPDASVTLAERVTWPDGALGCPRPDEGYTQALAPGYRIVVETPDGDVVLHGADGGEPFVCDDPGEPV